MLFWRSGFAFSELFLTDADPRTAALSVPAWLISSTPREDALHRTAETYVED